MKLDKFIKMFREQDEKDNNLPDPDKENQPIEPEKDKKNADEEGGDKEDVNLDDREDTSKEEEEQKHVLDKYETISKDVLSGLNDIVDKKPDVVLNKVKAVGIDDMLRDYIENSFIPKVDDTKLKLFITANIDEFIAFVAEKFTTEFIKK